MIYKTVLKVNGKSISLTEFAHNYLTNILICVVSMLKGGENVETLSYSLEDENSELVINGKVVPLIPFLCNAQKGIITGFVLSLKGIEKIDTLQINLRKS